MSNALWRSPLFNREEHLANASVSWNLHFGPSNRGRTLHSIPRDSKCSPSLLLFLFLLRLEAHLYWQHVLAGLFVGLDKDGRRAQKDR